MNSTPPVTDPGTPRHHLAHGPIRRHARVICVLAGAVILQLALIASFAGVMTRPALQDAAVGLVTPAASRPATVPRLTGASYVVLGSRGEAEQEVRDGQLPAALVTGGRTGTLLVASAAGPALVTAIGQEVSGQAAAAGTRLTIDDVRPLPPGDPRGLGSFLLVIGWIIGGYLGMTLLGRVLGGGTRTPRGTAALLAWTGAYAIASGALGVVLVDPLMGVLTGHPWTLLAAGSLTVFTAAVCTAALMSLLGLSGIVVAIVMFVVLGNPTSAGAVPVQMMSAGYRFLAQVLPTNASVGLVRALAYFGGQQIARPLLVLSLYAGVSLAILAGRALRAPAPVVAAGQDPLPATPVGTRQ